MRKFLILVIGLLLLICSGSCNLYPLYIKHLLEKYNLTIKEANIYGSCINLGLWVAFPTGFIYDKFGHRVSLIIGLIFLPGSYLILHFLLNSTSAFFADVPFFLLALLALILGQGSAILHTTAFSINMNNFHLKNSSYLVSMLALNMSVGPSILAFFKENISYFNKTNFYFALSLFLSTIIIISYFVFKNFHSEDKDIDENAENIRKEKEMTLIKSIYKFNIFICLAYIFSVILNYYTDIIDLKKYMIYVIPFLILLQFLLLHLNHKKVYGSEFFIESKNQKELNYISQDIHEKNSDIENTSQICKGSNNTQDLGIINIPQNLGLKAKGNHRQNGSNNNYTTNNTHTPNGASLINEEISNYESNKELQEKHYKSEISDSLPLLILNRGQNGKFLFMLFLVLFFGMGSIISNYNNIQFLVDNLYLKDFINEKDFFNKNANIQEDKQFDNLNMQSNHNNSTNLFNFNPDMKNETILNNQMKNNKSNSFDTPITVDRYLKKQIFFYLILYFSCNGITRMFSNFLLQYFIEKDRMFYHLLLTSSIGLISQFIGMQMNKDYLIFVIALCGFCHGLYMTFVPIFVKKFFSHKDFGKTMGVLTTGSALGSLVNSNIFFIYSYQKYGTLINETINFKICREPHCFSYSYLTNMILFSFNVIISIIFILYNKSLVVFK